MRPARQRQTRVTVAGLVLIVAGLLVWWFNRGADEPTYAGRRVSSWFRQYYMSGEILPRYGSVSPQNPEETARHDQAGNALDALGTNALPYLLGICFSTNQNTRFQTNLHAWLVRLPKPFRGSPLVPISLVRDVAEQRIIDLKPAPAALLPSITNHLAASNQAQRLTALRLLLGLNPFERIAEGLFSPLSPRLGLQKLDAVQGVEHITPWLVRSLGSSNASERELALGIIIRYGSAFKGALPEIMRLEADAFALTNLPVPRLFWGCGQALGAMGTNAAPALPLLKTQLAQLSREESPALLWSRRLFLAEVICRIDARELAATLALLEELRKGMLPDQIQFADSLGRIGPNANAAVPLLLEILNRSGLEATEILHLADALQRIGAEKQVWEPPMRKVLQDQDMDVRFLTACTLQSADPGNVAAITAFSELIKGKSDRGMDAIRELGKAGPLAKAAIPALREARKSQAKGAGADAFRAEAAKALAKIEGLEIPK